MMKKLILVLVVLLIHFSACKKAEEPYRLNATELTLTIGETFRFIVSKGETEHNITEFEVKSSNIPIGRMNPKGVFTAENRGKTVLTVETESSILKCDITVK